jgi:hypothetical protein
MIRESGRFVLLADSDVCGGGVVWQERILIALSCFSAGYVVSWLHGYSLDDELLFVAHLQGVPDFLKYAERAPM